MAFLSQGGLRDAFDAGSERTLSVAPLPPPSFRQASRAARPRLPRGYLGLDHQTRGSDLGAVLRILKLPEQVSGDGGTQALETVEPDHWYPVERLLELLETVDLQLGHYGLIRLGRTLFDLSHKAQWALGDPSARGVLYGLDRLYRFSNRGENIGGWRVKGFGPGYAELEKTTPHHCVMEQGMLAAALAFVGCPGTVTQAGCFREGQDACRFVVRSTFDDERWFGRST